MQTRPSLSPRATAPRRLLLSGLILLGGSLTPPALAQSGVAGWGSQVFQSSWNDEAFAQVAAGGNHTVALLLEKCSLA